METDPQDHWDLNPLYDDDYKIQVVKGFIFASMMPEHSKHKRLLEGLKVIAKPGKAVEALKSYPTGKLVLVPTTNRVHMGSGNAPNGSIGLGIFLRNSEGEPVCASLVPATSPKCMAAFWFVTISNKLDECNMKLSTDNSDVDFADTPVDQVAIKLPLMVNTQTGDRLVVFREKVSKAYELEELQTEPKKRRRTKTASA